MIGRGSPMTSYGPASTKWEWYKRSLIVCLPIYAKDIATDLNGSPIAWSSYPTAIFVHNGINAQNIKLSYGRGLTCWCLKIYLNFVITREEEGRGGWGAIAYDSTPPSSLPRVPSMANRLCNKGVPPFIRPPSVRHPSDLHLSDSHFADTQIISCPLPMGIIGTAQQKEQNAEFNNLRAFCNGAICNFLMKLYNSTMRSQMAVNIVQSTVRCMKWYVTLSMSSQMTVNTVQSTAL